MKSHKGENMKDSKNRVNNIQSLVNSANRNLKKAQRLLDSLEQDVSNSHDDSPGTFGVFDGTHMIAADGKKYEVNANYVAKSLLVPGDNLKMVEEGDKQLFKQVSKVPRVKKEGILNKKEGKWYVITDAGSYRVLDVAVDFRRGDVNDEAAVLVPEGANDNEYAALEKLAKEDKKPVIGEPKKKKEEKKKEDKKDKEDKKPKKRVTKKKKEDKEEKKEKKTKAKTTKPKATKKKTTTTRKTNEFLWKIIL